jgi:phosphonopyruvate decarboxylase
MIDCSSFFNSLIKNNIDFFTGVPDSLLKDICAYITDNADDKHHVISTNEGAAVSLATGYHLATGKVPLVYLQNSGLGNTINPLLSISDKEVYAIPMILMIGWRGEPGKKDEPQHVKQGRVQNEMLRAMEIPYEILDGDSENYAEVIQELSELALSNNCPVALIVKSKTFNTYKLISKKTANFEMAREDAINLILKNCSKDDIVVSTTGKASREVFEYRERHKQGHHKDFLTVGGMGHANQISLGIAMNSDERIICIDGDGAILMHLGSLGIIGNSKAKNLIHIVINNEAHDSVGGQPTIANEINLIEIATACGYSFVKCVTTSLELEQLFEEIDHKEGPMFLEIKTRKGARENLGRPTLSPIEIKEELMNTLKKY